jgi:hypothetical protein
VRELRAAGAGKVTARLIKVRNQSRKDVLLPQTYKFKYGTSD